MPYSSREFDNFKMQLRHEPLETQLEQMTKYRDRIFLSVDTLVDEFQERQQDKITQRMTRQKAALFPLSKSKKALEARVVTLIEERDMAQACLGDPIARKGKDLKKQIQALTLKITEVRSAIAGVKLAIDEQNDKVLQTESQAQNMLKDPRGIAAMVHTHIIEVSISCIRMAEELKDVRLQEHVVALLDYTDKLPAVYGPLVSQEKFLQVGPDAHKYMTSYMVQKVAEGLLEKNVLLIAKLTGYNRDDLHRDLPVLHGAIADARQKFKGELQLACLQTALVWFAAHSFDSRTNEVTMLDAGMYLLASLRTAVSLGATYNYYRANKYSAELEQRVALLEDEFEPDTQSVLNQPIVEQRHLKLRRR